MTPWFPSVYGDHLYATCPALRRNTPSPRPWDESCGSIGDPFDVSVCGWCQRVYRARQPSANAGTEAQP